MSECYKLKNGEELMIGLDIYGKWQVSSWDKDLNCRWEKRFDTEAEARGEFERCKVTKS